MKTLKDVSRRDFIKTTALVGGGLLISFSVPGAKRLAVAKSASAGLAPNAFLRIGTDDSVTVILTHVEMGQGIWTTLPMLVAEELDFDWSKVKVEHSPPGKEYAHAVFGFQITGGSSSTWSEFDRYRMAGATARALLVAAAAQSLGVTPEDGDVAEAASKLTIPAAPKLKDAKDWKYIGKSIKRLDTPDKITGRAKFGMDMRFPDLLTAIVAHPPVFGAKVKSLDASKAKAVPGVRDVVQIPSGVAVVADHFWAAKLGRDALTVEWDLGPNATLDSKAQLVEYKKLADTKGMPAQQAGDVPGFLSKATKKIEAEYSVPYLAHASMEPLNCTVKISQDKCEIWTGTQFPGIDQAAAARILGFQPEQVTLHTPFLGGSFGRRSTNESDWVVEAVHIAKASGKFIKMVWTREDDMRGGYYRPAFLHRAAVGLGADGLPIAWQHRIVGQSIMHGTFFEAMMVKDGIDPTSVEGVMGSPYLTSVPNHSVELHSPVVGVPVLWWRSVGHTHTAFVMESLIDELATTAGKDAVEYRRSLLKTHPRHLSALNLVAEKAEWGKPLANGRFRGVAVHESFGSFVAEVAEITIEKGIVHVHRVVCAIDCGLAVNPEGVRAQMESGIVYGLSAALFGEITLEKGQVKQQNFNNYRVLRMNEMPVIEVHIVPSSERMGGAGEPGVPPIAPAVTNAIFAATGKRIRSLPVRASDLV